MKLEPENRCLLTSGSKLLRFPGRGIREQGAECRAGAAGRILNTGSRPQGLRYTAHENKRSTLGVRRRARPQRGRYLLLLGADDWRLLPSVVRLAPAEAGERPVPPHSGRRRAGRLPPVPALQAGSAADRTDACGAVAEICRLIESAPETPTLASLSETCGPQPLLLPSRFQGGDRTDAEGIRIGAPREARSQRARKEGEDRDRSHLRRRVQLERPFL